MSNVLARRAALAAIPVLALGVTLTAGATPSFAGAAQTRYVSPAGADNVDGKGPNDCTVAATPCKTIQYAIGEATAGDTVSLAAGTYAESVQIQKSLVLTGAGRGTTVLTGAGDMPSVLIEPGIEQADGPSVALQHLSLSGNSQAPGVAAEISTVSLLDTEVDANTTAGVFSMLSDVAISRSTVSRTVDTDGNGDDSAPFATGGGVVALLSNVVVDHSTTAGNVGSGVELIGEPILPGAVRSAVVRSLAAGAPEPQGSLALGRSTVSRNGEGGVLNAGGVVALAADTFSGNTGGGIVTFGGAVGVTDSTITGTVPFPDSQGTDMQGGLITLPDISAATSLLPSAARRAAGAEQLERVLTAHPAAVRHAAAQLAPAAAAPSSTAVEVSGSIVAAQRGLPDCYGVPVDGGYNLSSDAKNSCAFGTAKHDQVRTDAMLGGLADNGGATKTEVPLKGSPAIDAIPAGKAGCTAGGTDQRDAARVQPTAGRCDTGSVELAAKAIVIRPSSLPDGKVGHAYAATLAAAGGAYPTYSWTLASGSLPNGLTIAAGGRISGTPTKAGSFTFTVAVNDPVLKTYTVVIAAPPAPPVQSASAAPAGNGSDPIASTGAHVGPLLLTGSLAVLLGLLLLVVAGAAGRRSVSRHRGA